ncbi:MAG TPA: DUF92 domain-containing protein [Gemmatimonadales bacterium]|nr:DUF92 domain-containing protein [Gemmatimonadales bacterium]
MPPELRIPGLGLAALLSAAIAGAGWRAGALSGAGALAASVVGTVVLGAAGWAGGAALAAFFVSASLMSGAAPARVAPEADAKGNRRDPWQVLANGGPAALGSLLAWGEPSLALWIVTASLAAAAADTWATSGGAWSRHPPRHLLSWRAVPPGTNGGVTAPGTLAAAVGAMLVAGTAAGVARAPGLLPVGTLVGFGGMVLDSALGAGLQGRFECPACGVGSERRAHRCGARTLRRGGLAWLTNDGVNAIATGAAAAAGWAAWAWLSPVRG